MEPVSMSKRAIGASYAHSFLWLVLLTAVTVGVMSIAHLVFVDIIHGNPHRTRDDVISMMAVETPIIAVIAAIGSILVFTLPQIFQAALIAAWYRMLGNRARFVVLAALPLTAVLTWYCYDYLTPSNVGLGIMPARTGLRISMGFRSRDTRGHWRFRPRLRCLASCTSTRASAVLPNGPS
jgi:hypothetical protein